MIFITLGTHEQPFDRLIGEVNRLLKEKIIIEDIFMQVGYHYNIKPSCKYEEFISLEEMNQYMKKARVVVVHGGFGSIIQAFINGKIPVVVPRRMEYGEHVDNHQVLFSKHMAEEKRIIPVFDIDGLGKKILFFEREIQSLGRNIDPVKDIERRSRIFASKLDKICRKLLEIP